MDEAYKFRIVDGLLEIEVGAQHDRQELMSMLRNVVRRWSTAEIMSLEECVKVFRASRMYYELQTESRFTHIDAADLEVLYSLKEDRVAWLHKALNAHRGTLRCVGHRYILIGDQMAKDVYSVVES